MQHLPISCTAIHRPSLVAPLPNDFFITLDRIGSHTVIQISVSDIRIIDLPQADLDDPTKNACECMRLLGEQRKSARHMAQEAPLTAAERRAVAEVARGFRSGALLRAVFDGASHAAWTSAAAQRALLAATVAYVPAGAPPDFRFGTWRCARFVRLLFEKVEGGEIDEGLVEVAAAMGARGPGECGAEGAVFIVIDTGWGGGMREVVLRVSELFSDLGMRLWAAGCVLFDCVRTGLVDVRAANVLELGSGVGLTATALVDAGAKSAILTDYRDDVIENLAYNIANNARPSPSATITTDVQTAKLDVSQVDAAIKLANERCVDVILAADLSYDPQLSSAVVTVYEAILTQTCARVGYLFAKRRSEESDNKLVSDLSRTALCVDEVALWTEDKAPAENIKGSFAWMADSDLRSVKMFRLRPRETA